MEKIIKRFIAGDALLSTIENKLNIQKESPSEQLLDIVTSKNYPQFLVYGEELISVPTGTRILQFIKEKGTTPLGQMGIWLNSIYFTEFHSNFQEYILLKIAMEEKDFFRFIPPEYRRDRGVTVKKDGTIVLCSDLIHAMNTGMYSWCDTEWNWDRDTQPVAFTKSKNDGMLIWFYDYVSKNWKGWTCQSCGTPVFCRIKGDPDKPDFISDRPKDSEEFYTDPVFQRVNLKKFIGFISDVFGSDKEVKTPQEFATSMASRPFDSWQGCASFYAIPSPQNEWGWVYETISGRQLIWLPCDMVFTRGMRESQNFRSTVEEALGASVELAEPEYLDAELTLAIKVDRPCISEYGEEPSEVQNESFFAAINRKPFEVYEKVVPPISPVRSYDFYATIAEEKRLTREKYIYNALQTLQASAR